MNLIYIFCFDNMGIGDWGLGIGVWGVGAKPKTPKTQTPKQKPQKKFFF